MTNAIWCDPGEHAFPEGQVGSTTMGVAKMIKDQWGNHQINLTQTVCAAHAVELGLTDISESDASLEEEAARATRIATGRIGGFLGKKRAAITADTKVNEARAKDYDPDYTAALEWMADHPDEKLPWQK